MERRRRKVQRVNMEEHMRLGLVRDFHQMGMHETEQGESIHELDYERLKWMMATLQAGDD